MCLLGAVVRRYIDFLILLIPTPLVSALFCSSIPTFCSQFILVRCKHRASEGVFYIYRRPRICIFFIIYYSLCILFSVNIILCIYYSLYILFSVYFILCKYYSLYILFSVNIILCIFYSLYNYIILCIFYSL